ncbi:GNAT family N-acetyltransferase [Brucella sp. BE17]|uniref:GNAT family N-acetyltransferase n=1 Tax=Brucella sp. BE17 TaxID=3142977 RepID=UPI0031BB3AE6
MPNLAVVRQLEAVGFRAWPAGSVHYDGTWAIRLTPAHPSKRLNSVNPLDPGDIRDIANRVGRAVEQFRAAGRAPCFRLSPLAPHALDAHLEALGWTRKEETIVMTVNLTNGELSDAFDLDPIADIQRFADTSVAIHGHADTLRAGIVAVLDSIRLNKGMFVLQQEGRSVASTICVQDGAMAALFDVATLPDERRKGFGNKIVGSALKWAANCGARTAWLQIGADNVAGLKIYERFGFKEAYRYFYRESNDK